MWYFKHVGWISYCICGVGIAIIFLGFAYLPKSYQLLNDISSIALIGLIFAWAFGWRNILSKYITRRFAKITNILENECDPERYIKEISEILERAPTNKPAEKTKILLYMCYGWYEAGDLERVDETLSSIREFNTNVNGLFDKIFYYHMLFSACIKKNELEKAEETLGQMESVCSKFKKEKQRQGTNRNIQMDQIILNMERDNYDNAEQFFSDKFAKATCMLIRIATKGVLSQIYLHFGRKDEAKEALKYIILNGNKLYRVTKAKDLLLDIGENN